MRLFPLVERKQDKGKIQKLGERRRCKAESCSGIEKREVYKPDRTHHCKICDRCVLRMDHHCPWIANCVGFNNYKFFLLLLLYALCSLGFILGALFPRLLNVFMPILDVKYFLSKDMVVIIAYVITLFLFITLTMFFGFHLWLVFHAMTTIEYREKSQVKHRFEVSRMKYDYGFYYNFVHVFGPWWMWLFPLTLLN